jgi:hypothetical protein
MAEKISIAQSDVDSLGKKLDEFQSVLSDRERQVMYAVMQMAGKELRETLAGGSTTGGGDTSTLPPLSSGFRDAFSAGVGKSFQIRSSETERGVGIGVVWDAA